MIQIAAPFLIAGGVILASSLAGNAWLFSKVGDAREAAGRSESARVNAVAAATSCSDGVADLQTKILQQTADAADAIEAARAAGRAAGIRAQTERNRIQAVPGDACASAQVENSEWLKRRQAEK